MPTCRFTDRKIYSLSTHFEREEFTDETLPDLMFRVSRAGSKLWVVRDIGHGRRRRLRLGTDPAIPPVEARQKTLEILARVSAVTESDGVLITLDDGGLGVGGELSLESFSEVVEVARG